MEAKEALGVTHQQVAGVEEDVPGPEDIGEQLSAGQLRAPPRSPGTGPPGSQGPPAALAHLAESPGQEWPGLGAPPSSAILPGQLPDPTRVGTWSCGHTAPSGVPKRLPCGDIAANQREGEDMLGEGRPGTVTSGSRPSCPRGLLLPPPSLCKARRRGPRRPAVPCS